MGRPTIRYTANMTPDVKRRLMNAVAPLDGLYDVHLKPTRRTRSNQQLAWYWPCIVQPFYEFLKAQDWDIADEEDAHDLLRQKFLRVPMAFNEEQGTVRAWRVRRTRELDTEEFSDYCERCRAWLADFFGIVTVAPDGTSTISEDSHAIVQQGDDDRRTHARPATQVLAITDGRY